MGEIVIKKVIKPEKGYMYVTKKNPDDEGYLDLMKVKCGRKPKGGD